MHRQTVPPAAISDTGNSANATLMRSSLPHVPVMGAPIGGWQSARKRRAHLAWESAFGKCEKHSPPTVSYQVVFLISENLVGLTVSIHLISSTMQKIFFPHVSGYFHKLLS